MLHALIALIKSITGKRLKKNNDLSTPARLKNEQFKATEMYFFYNLIYFFRAQERT